MIRRGWAVVVLSACAACARSEQVIELKAAFSDVTVVGELRPSWTATGETRPGAAGDVQRFVLRLDAVNRLNDPIYLRLSELRVRDSNAAIATQNPTPCALPSGPTRAVLQTDVWLPAGAADDRALEIDYFALPLSERGRAFYREFLLQQRPAAAAAIDAEIAAYAAAPVCASQ